MLLYTAPQPDKLESYQERGDISTFDVGEAQMDTFIYENLSGSRENNIRDETWTEVRKVFNLAPELFGPQSVPHTDPNAPAILQQAWNEKAQGENELRASDWEGFIEPNLADLKARFPDANIRDRDEIDADIASKAAGLRSDFEEKYEFSDTFAGFFGMMGGGVVGAMYDPINIATMPFSAGRVTTGSFLKSLSTVVGRSFGIGAAIEGTIQPFVYNYKKEIESPYELRDALFAMGMGGIGFAVLAGGGHTIGRAWNKFVTKKPQPLRDTYENRAMVRDIETLFELQKFADDVGVTSVPQLEAHVSALNKAMADAKAGREIDYKAIDESIDKAYLKELDGEVKAAQSKLASVGKEREALNGPYARDGEIVEPVTVKNTAGSTHEIIDNGEVVGSFELSKGKKYVTITDPSVVHQGESFAVSGNHTAATYLAVAKAHPHKQVKSGELTPESAKIWEEFYKDGRATRAKDKGGYSYIMNRKGNKPLGKKSASKMEALNQKYYDAEYEAKEWEVDRQNYLQEKVAESTEAMKTAPTDTPKMAQFKSLVNSLVDRLGANGIEVKVHEGDFRNTLANPDDMRFSNAEDIDFKEVDPDALIENIPYIDDFSFLEGKTIRPTFADLTDAGTVYSGIDSTQIEGKALQGGPDFPFLNGSQGANIVWAVDGAGIPTKMKGSDYIVVSSMSENTHQSNATVTKAVFDTLEAYIKEGRISSKEAIAINDHIKKSIKTYNEKVDVEYGKAVAKAEKQAKAAIKKGKKPSKAKPTKAAKFPPFVDVADTVAFDAYVKSLTFERRAALVNVIDSAKIQDLSAPSVRKVLKNTISKKYAGHNLGDALVIIKVDPDQPTITLGEHGTHKHDSYQYGLKGKVVGRLHAGVKLGNLFPDAFAKRRAAGEDPAGDYRSISLSVPTQTVTKEIISHFKTEPYKAITSPRQLKLSMAMAKGDWRGSDNLVKEGGVSVADFIKAVKTSEASSTLTSYTRKGVTADIKSGKMTVHQLADSEIFFATKNNHSYKEEYGFEHPDLTDNEVLLTGVVNNESSAKGVGAPSVVLKAIEEGVTVLDAFAVKSAKYPDGFLPHTYSKFGFEVIGYVKFDPKYALDPKEGGSPAKLADIKKFWTDNGWNEADGYPDMAIMKWRGSDDLRSNATRRFDTEDFRGADSSPARQPLAKARTVSGGRDLGSIEESVGGRTDIGDDTGPVRDSNGTGGSSRAHSSIREALGLTDKELDNLGVSRAEMDEIKDILGVRYSMAGGKAEAAINPETGELHINASAFRDEAHLLEVMREEIIGHYGLRKSLGDEFEGVIRDIKSSAKNNPELQRLWTELSGVDPSTGQVVNSAAPYRGAADDVIADEIISKMARSEISDSIFLAIKNLIVKGLRKIGLIQDDITITEMRSLVAKSEQALKKTAIKTPVARRVTNNLSNTVGARPTSDNVTSETVEVEASRIMNDESIPDGLVFDEHGNSMSIREALLESDNDLAGIESVRVCML